MSGTLRMITAEKEPFIYFDENSRAYKGMLIDLVNELARRLNFTYIISEESTGQYGYQDDNGNWNGIVGALINGTADVGLAAVSLTSERMRVVDFTDPIWPSTGFSLLIQKPEVHTVFWRFFTVLSLKVWLCITASFVLTSAVIWVFDRYSPYSYRNKKKAREKRARELELWLAEHANDEISESDSESVSSESSDDNENERRYFGAKESLWFILTSLTPQGGGVAPLNYSGRLVSTTWWLFGFIIVASYTANLAAFLTIARFDRTIDTFHDLLSHFRYTYTAVRNTEASRYFERRKDIEYKFYDAWKALTLNDELSPYERSMLAVWEYPFTDKYNKLDGAMKFRYNLNSFKEAMGKFTEQHTKFALIAETTDVQYQVMTNCSFKELGPEFSKRPYAIALPKDSPLTEPFNQVIRDLYDDRWFKRSKKKWWTNNPKKVSCYDMNEKKVGVLIENVGGLFMTIFMGIGLSLVVMLGEYIYLKTNFKRLMIFKRFDKTKEICEKQSDNDKQVACFDKKP